MKETTYTVALIGIGNMSRGHVHELLAQPRFKIIGACDPSATAREAFTAVEGVELFAEVAPMMEKRHPDFVVIVAPDAVHAALTKQVAAYAPKAILCEKPMAVRYADAVDMVETCEAKGVELLINHQRRLVIEPYVRTLLADGTLGDLLECEARCAGDLIGDGTHAVDSLMAIGGDLSPETVWGMIDLV
jgi:predicted dehydrogenase